MSKETLNPWFLSDGPPSFNKTPSVPQKKKLEVKLMLHELLHVVNDKEYKNKREKHSQESPNSHRGKKSERDRSGEDCEPAVSKKRQRKEEDKLLMGLNTTTADPKKNMKTSMADASLESNSI